MFRIVVVAGLLGCLLGPPCVAAEPARQAAMTAALARADKLVQRNELDGDVAFYIGQGARTLGKELRLKAFPKVERGRDTFPYSIDYELWRLRNAKLLAGLSIPVNVLGDAGFKPDKANLLSSSPDVASAYAEQVPWVLQVMKNALSCQPGQDAVPMVGEPDYEYISVHQVLGLMVAHQRGCFSDQQVSGVLTPYVTRLWREFSAAPQGLTNIQLERAALLCMAGHCARLPDSFVLSMVKAQRPEGYWMAEKDPVAKSGVISPGHTSALVYYILSRRVAG